MLSVLLYINSCTCTGDDWKLQNSSWKNLAEINETETEDDCQLLAATDYYKNILLI